MSTKAYRLSSTKAYRLSLEEREEAYYTQELKFQVLELLVKYKDNSMTTEMLIKESTELYNWITSKDNDD